MSSFASTRLRNFESQKSVQYCLRLYINVHPMRGRELGVCDIVWLRTNVKTDSIRWPNTVFARALADAIQHVHKHFKKQTCRQQSDHFIYLTPALTVLFFSITERSVLMALVFYYKDMFRIGKTMPRTQQFSAFVCYRKNPVKCNACAVARKIETDCFSRNVPISNDPVVRILRNLAKKK